MVSTKRTIFLKLQVSSELYINLSLVFSENIHLQVMCSLVGLTACLEGGREGMVGTGGEGERTSPPAVLTPVCSPSTQSSALPCSSLARGWSRAPEQPHKGPTQHVPICCRLWHKTCQPRVVRGQHPGASPAQQKY